MASEMDSKEKQYQEAIDWLFGQLPMFSRVGAAAYKPGLDNTLALDSIYRSPHKQFKAIHIAGTNGKGSTSHTLAAVLQANGYKTGLYTSPHLLDFRERIRIDGKMIPKESVVEFVNDWRQRNSDLKPSFFELTMMMAFDWFAKEKVDVAVVEVGMGGRLDSTNIITPLLSIITNISFDHTQFLGSTLEDIAREKAGIIKPGVPVVIGEAEGRVKEVFDETAREKRAEITFAEEQPDIRLDYEPAQGWRLEIDSDHSAVIPLRGRYQGKNMRTVAAALRELQKVGIPLEADKTVAGLEGVVKLTGLRGRWEQVGDAPVVICDTGHNEGGITENMETLKALFPGKHIRFVVGFVNDKDVAHIVNLFPAKADYYFTRASIPRAMQQQDVAEIFAQTGIQGTTYPTVKEAYRAALADSSKEDVIYVGGSTFIVADFLADLQV